MTDNFTGFQCWHTERISSVINKEALSVKRADFLATHMPLRRIVYERSPHQIGETSENGLLEELIQRANEDQHTFAVIKGAPGTGKSHLIRWLKEQYQNAYPGDAVLLIARSRTSLRDTIQQIIDSSLFQGTALPDHLKRLRSAAEVLSQEKLAERLLNGLQEASRQISWDDELQHRLNLQSVRLEVLQRRLANAKIEKFLLDFNVREKLKEAGGPIERVTTFLTAGSGDGLGTDKMPGFEAADLVFKSDFRRALGGSIYREVRDLADDVSDKTDLADAFTRYLNHILRSYAIGIATQLAAGDLRAMFNDVRTALRAQGRNLALFIEDISAFTGIDEGLVEVLITQHRAEAGAEYCRLTSVIGVTDAYFTDRFPDNIKERVTHRLTLNAPSGRGESDLLRDERARSEFAARYLNALRVSEQALVDWAQHNTRPDLPPNACEECRFRQVCHSTFGTVELRSDVSADAITVGLYPFNQAALTTAYDFLKDTFPRTPRTLLYDILADILISHSEKIQTGGFPPALMDFNDKINAPSFNPPSHGRIVTDQGGMWSERLTTLLLYWGERNAFPDESGGIGGLPPALFEAFQVPRIRGAERQISAPLIDEPEEKPLPAPPETPAESKFTKNINAWALGGKLFAYDRFTDWMVDLAKSFIDWQAHGISASQVDAYLKGGRRFVIQDQAGAITTGTMHIRFSRSDELRYALQALADLNDSALTLTPEEYGEHLTTLSQWIRSEEKRIVDFVREPSQTVKDIPRDYLLRLTLIDCVFFAVLSGDINPGSVADVQLLFNDVIASCVRSAEGIWKARIEDLRQTHPPEWIQLMRKLDRDNSVHKCRFELLQLLNRPQGASTNVRYLDAAAALSILSELDSTDWTMPSLAFKPDTSDQIWSNAIHCYDLLQMSFVAALTNIREVLRIEHEKVNAYLGGETPKSVFASVRAALDTLRPAKAYPPTLNAAIPQKGIASTLTPERLDQTLAEMSVFLEQMAAQAAVELSTHYSRWLSTLRDYNAYFDLFAKHIALQSQQFEKENQELSAVADPRRQLKETLHKFDQLYMLVKSVVQSEQPT